jgi:hypothetical protein
MLEERVMGYRGSGDWGVKLGIEVEKGCREVVGGRAKGSCGWIFDLSNCVSC